MFDYHNTSRVSQKILFLFLPVLLLISPGCKDDDPVIYNFGASSEDFMQSYLTFTHSFFNVHTVLCSLEDSLDTHTDGSYAWKNAQVSVQPPEPAVYPKSFTIDFDSSRLYNHFSGSITGNISASYLTKGSYVAFTFNELKIMDGWPSGSCTVSNQGISAGKTLFEFSISNGSLIRYPGTDTAVTVEFQGNQDVLWSVTNDELNIPEGLLSGRASDSLLFYAEVNQSYHLIKEADCDYIRDGIFDLTVKNTVNSEVGNGIADFGYVNPATCDKYAIIVIDGETSRSEYIYIMEWLAE